LPGTLTVDTVPGSDTVTCRADDVLLAAEALDFAAGTALSVAEPAGAAVPPLAEADVADVADIAIIATCAAPVSGAAGGQDLVIDVTAAT
jgi:hypothetical protein